METIIDYVMRLEEKKTMDIYTKQNIINYTSDPDAGNDKKYPKPMQVARKALREDDMEAKKDDGTFDWGYLLSRVDSF